MTDIDRPQTAPATPMTRRAILRRAALGLAGIGLVDLSVACNGNGGAQQSTDAPVSGVTEVAVRDNYFEPASIAVPVGATVTWTWDGDRPHNVTGDGFASDTERDGSFTHTFTEPGRRDYRCTLHSGMNGAVVVTEAAS